MRGHVRALVVGTLVPIASATAQELDPASIAFLEVTASAQRTHVEQPITLRYRFGIDRQFQQDSMVPLFRRDLDVPIQILSGASEESPSSGPPGTVPVVAETGLRFAFDDTVVEALRQPDETRAGREFAVFVHDRILVPEHAGPLTFPAARLRFAYATAFHEDFLGRTPLDRHETSLAGPSLRVEAMPLPDDGRPEGYGGAVGRFRIRAEVSTRELSPQESLRLTIAIEGDGNLTRFTPPRLDDLVDWHALGFLDDTASPRRTITYDLVPTRAGEVDVPPVRLSFFDPEAGQYRSVSTTPTPIRVKDAAGQVPSPTPIAREASDAASRLQDVPMPSPHRGRWPGIGLALAAVGVAAFAALVVASEPGDGELAVNANAAELANTAFHQHMQGTRPDPAPALTAFLSLHLDCTPAAITGPQLAGRLQAAGVDISLAGETAQFHEALVAARYGGPKVRDAQERARALVARLEAVLN